MKGTKVYILTETTDEGLTNILGVYLDNKEAEEMAENLRSEWKQEHNKGYDCHSINYTVSEYTAI